jgi:hypothetical protein
MVSCGRRIALGAQAALVSAAQGAKNKKKSEGMGSPRLRPFGLSPVLLALRVPRGRMRACERNVVCPLSIRLLCCPLVLASMRCSHTHKRRPSTARAPTDKKGNKGIRKDFCIFFPYRIRRRRPLSSEARTHAAAKRPPRARRVLDEPKKGPAPQGKK